MGKELISALCVILSILFGYSNALTEDYEKLDLLFIVPTHDGVGHLELGLIKQVVRDLVFPLEISECQQKVALINYGSTPQVIWDFADDTAKNSSSFETALDGLSLIGGQQQSLVPVIEKATEVFNSRANRLSAPDMTIFIISAASESTNGLEKAVARLKKFSYVLVVPITTSPNITETDAIADKTLTINDYTQIVTEIQNKTQDGECQDCRPGFTELDITNAGDLKGDIVGRKKRKTRKNFEDMLKSDMPVQLSLNNRIIIKRDKDFYLAKFCIQTQYVAQIKLKGLDASKVVVTKEKIQVKGNGQTMTKTCSFFKQKQEDVETSSTCIMRFYPIEGHTGKMKVQDLYMLACGV